MKNIIFTAILICLSHFSSAQNNYIKYDDIAYNTISGVNQNLLSLDVYKPTLFSGNRPVVIYIHGGYWSGGDKNNVGFKDNVFTDSGYVFVSINYRLSPDPVDTLSTTAVRFPIHPQDCADAVKWVMDSISNYGGDTSKVSLIGHSAGAHLALLLSTNQTFLQNVGVNPSKIKCSCALDCGVFDLIEEFQQAGNNIQRRAPLLNAFGSDATIYDDASPQYNIQPGKTFPWLHTVHQNTADRIYANQRFADSLQVNGYTHHNLFNADPYNHGTINTALGSPADSIGMTASVMQFFGNCLANNLTTGIDETDTELSKLLLYPNPVNNLLHIQNPDNKTYDYTICDLLGRTMLKGKFQQHLNVSGLPKGVYLLQLRTENESSITIKFVKE